MATKIRLSRAGAKKRPFYRMVVADSRSPRDGKFIEKVGTYDPLLAKDDAKRVVLKRERIEYWLSVGAQISEKVEKLVEGAGIAVPYTSKKSKQSLEDKPKKAPKKQKAAQ